MRRNVLAALLAFAVLGTGSAPAQETAQETASETPAEPLRLSLADAVRRALDEGTAARLATTEISEAQARALEARSVLQPQISAGTLTANESLNLVTFGFQPAPGEPPVVGPFNVLDAHLTVAMNVIDVAARRRWAAARAGVRVSEEERRRIENEVAAAVASLYVSMGRGAARIDEIRANVDLFERLRQLAVDQKKAGLGTRLDTTRADFQLARQRQALVVATNQRDLARLALLRAIGADLGTDLVLTDDWSRAGDPVPSLGQALAAARQGRPELTVFQEQLRAAGLAVETARAERLPTVGAQAQATESGNRVGDLAWSRTFAATVNVPLFTGRRVEAHVAEAQARQERLRLQQGDVERQVEQEVRQALLALESARSRVELAEQSVKLATDELEQASDRFKAGVAPSIEVDNAQTSLASARDLRVDALADEAQARFDLARATGGIRGLIPENLSNATQSVRQDGGN
jgi:outer membrane protein TolC